MRTRTPRVIAVLLATTFAGAMAAAAHADVVVRVQVFEEKADAEPDALPQGEAAVTIETRAAAGGSFFTRTRLGKKQTFEFKGSVKSPGDGDDSFQVSVSFSELSQSGQRQLSTTLILKPDQPHAVGKSGERKVVMTILTAAEERE